MVEAALFEGRAPVLVVPQGSAPVTAPKTVLVAWNESIEAMAAIQPCDCTGLDARRRLLFGTENDDMRFNVGCLNVDTTAARVNFELFRSDGALLGSESVILMPFDNNQLNRIFDPYHPAVGYVDYWSAATSGRVWCYGSVLDNVTSDPTTVPPQ